MPSRDICDIEDVLMLRWTNGHNKNNCNRQRIPNGWVKRRTNNGHAIKEYRHTLGQAVPSLVAGLQQLRRVGHNFGIKTSKAMYWWTRWSYSWVEKWQRRNQSFRGPAISSPASAPAASAGASRLSSKSNHGLRMLELRQKFGSSWWS